MSIKSHAFGRVELTGQDAKKFNNQVTYGRPKAEAIESAERGLELSESFDKNHEIEIILEPKR